MIACCSAEGYSLGGARGAGLGSEDAGLAQCAAGSELAQVPAGRFD
jgi:hypothetical protein